MRRLSVVIFCMSSLMAAWAGGPDWPQFRGADGNGIVKAAVLPDAWPEAGPPAVWRVPLGPGYGEPVVVGDHIYTNTGDVEGEAKKEFLACYHAGDGREQWRIAMDDLLETEFGHGARATPTVDGDRVYAVSGSGTLLAARTDGTELWRVNYGEAYGSPKPMWGFSNSAVVEGDTLIVTAGGKNGQFLVGLDKLTGAKKWASLEGGPGYCTPTRVTLGGVRQLVVGAEGNVLGVDTEGHELWKHPFGRYLPIAQPTFVAPDKFLFSSSDEGLGMVVRVTSADAGYEVEELWRSKRFKNHFSGSVAWGDALIGFDVATLKCIASDTGDQLWAKRGYGKGALILAGDKLLILSDRGQVIMGRPGKDDLVELGRFQALEGRCWTAPVLVGTRLYVRNMTELACFELAGQGTKE